MSTYRPIFLVLLFCLVGGSPGEARECRGEGVSEVKAADEHCGFVSRERKTTALDAACRLAEDVETELRATAEREARAACLPRSEETCEVTFRRWENVYTHVLSQKCWTACGWAAVLRCEIAEEESGRREEGQPRSAAATQE